MKKIISLTIASIGILIVGELFIKISKFQDPLMSNGTNGNLIVYELLIIVVVMGILLHLKNLFNE